MPADQAEAIRLSFFEDHLHPDIERRLGVPLGTVRPRLRLAIQELRLALR